MFFCDYVNPILTTVMTFWVLKSPIKQTTSVLPSGWSVPSIRASDIIEPHMWRWNHLSQITWQEAWKLQPSICGKDDRIQVHSSGDRHFLALHLQPQVSKGNFFDWMHSAFTVSVLSADLSWSRAAGSVCHQNSTCGWDRRTCQAGNRYVTTTRTLSSWSRHTLLCTSPPVVSPDRSIVGHSGIIFIFSFLN